MENMARTMRLFPFMTQDIITEEMIRVRYEASARPGAQEALRKLIPKPNADGPTLVKGFPEASVAKIDRAHPGPARARGCGGAAALRFPAGAGTIPAAELHLFGRCGHWVQVEHRTRFLQLVRDFCAD
jgi:2-hydroxy-6-oxo-octa-2,4-dienoate hydrolase